MRRGGMLSASADTQALIPTEHDTGQVLELKWKTWAQRESFKRYDLYSCLMHQLTCFRDCVFTVFNMTHMLP
jgi:hypothetical protein